MLSIKKGVTLLGLVPQMVLAKDVVEDALAEFGVEDCVITSGNDGVHSETSQHYGGRAIDFRTRDLPDPPVDGPKLAARVAAALGQDFFVLFEKTHLHVHYAPKRPPPRTSAV